MKLSQTHPTSKFLYSGAWTHAPPVTVAHGKTHRHCSCCPLASQNWSQHCYGFFEWLFCNFRMV
jgi:hypothetical protein